MHENSANPRTVTRTLPHLSQTHPHPQTILKSATSSFLQQARYFWFSPPFFFVEPNQILSRINNLTIQTRNTVLSKQVFVPKRGIKKYQHFIYFISHLNQQNLPSATLVSKEIETDFNRRRRFFSKSSRSCGRSYSLRGGGRVIIKHRRRIPQRIYRRA